MIQTRYSLLDSWHERIPYGQSVELWLSEVQMYVLKTFSPNRKTRSHESKVTGKDYHRFQLKNSNYSSFILPSEFELKSSLFSKSSIYVAKCETELMMRENLIRKERKFWAAELEGMIFDKTHLPQTSWRIRNRLKTMFTWGKAAHSFL